MIALGAIAAVVVAAVVVATVLATRGSGDAGAGATSTAAKTATSGPATATSGSSTATGGGSGSAGGPTTASRSGPGVPSTCRTAPVDNSGMTPCLLAVAGPNADRALGCTSVTAADLNIRDAFGSVSLVSASACAGLDGGGVDVVYVQLDSADTVPGAMSLLAEGLSAPEKDWRSGSGSGRYVAAVGDRGPEIYWSYQSLPVIAYATTSSTLTGGTPAPTAQELGDYWKASLLPQPGG